MSNLKYPSTSYSRRQGLLIGIVICSLTISLATRFCIASSASPVHAVKSVERRSVDPKRQHVSRYAGLAANPARVAAPEPLVSLYVQVAHPDPVLPTAPANHSSYNRPPPFSSIIL
ncbi:MAG: hypothetical protein JOZ80_13265 [Acidobacteriaceae bacterium]|nr:hypothetical protein [Acidobacteriaceae bacterium]